MGCRTRVCPICGKSTKMLRKHIVSYHNLTMDDIDYLITSKNYQIGECINCHEIDLVRHGLCKVCESELSRPCTICGEPLLWRAGTHYSRIHNCERPYDFPDLKLLNCPDCGRPVKLIYVNGNEHIREHYELCDDCKKDYLKCPGCGEYINPGKLYSHIRRCQRDIELRNREGISYQEQFRKYLSVLTDEQAELEIKYAELMEQRIKEATTDYVKWRKGKSWVEQIGLERAADLKKRISETHKRNGTGWAWHERYDDDQKTEVAIKKHETRRVHRNWNKFGFSAVSKIVFDQLDELTKFKTYHSDNEWYVALNKEEAALLNKHLLLLDYYCPELSLVIEFNGDYWHTNPEYFDEDYVLITGERAGDIWAHDKLREEIVTKKLGIEHYFVLWETDNLDTLTEIRELMINANDN